MNKYTLKATLRDVVGRKVKKLRADGMTPATVYGKKVKSINIQVSSDELNRVYAQARSTGLVELSIDKDMRQVLIHTLQLHPVTDVPVHVEFFQVDLKEKVKSRVPVEFIGDSPVVLQKQGVLLATLNEIEVEALPADLPEKISVDVSALSAVDQELKVGDLIPPNGVTILTDVGVGVVKVGALVSKEAEAEATAEAAAKVAEAASAPAEGTSSADTASKGEAPKEVSQVDVKAVAPKEEKK